MRKWWTSRVTASVITPAVLAMLTPISSPALADDSDPPEQIQLTGVVRDFHEAGEPNGHPDMERRPDRGFGHYAGNIAPLLGADGKPVFTGQGSKVKRDWNDHNGLPIAPHMYNSRYRCDMPGSGAAGYDGCVTTKDGHGVDAFEICFVGVVYHDDGTSSWTYEVSELDTGAGLSHFIIALDESHELVTDGISPSSGWTWVPDSHPHYSITGIKWDMGGGVGPGQFTVRIDGHYVGQVQPDAVVAKGGPGPAGDQTTFFGPTTEVGQNESGPLTYDDVLEYDSDVNDSPGQLGQASTGGIASAESFNQWFRNVPGVNMSKLLTLTLYRNDEGTYVFDDREDPTYSDLGGFFPINDQLFGNSEGEDRNYHFTFELHTTFTYDEDGTQYFKFIGDDDVWVFIDGKLAIDLGGVHSRIEQYVDLSRFCLEDGEQYELSFFFAERHRTQSNFRIETNLSLESNPVPSVTAAFD